MNDELYLILAFIAAVSISFYILFKLCKCAIRGVTQGLYYFFSLEKNYILSVPSGFTV